MNQLGPYELLGVVGRGGMGTVYRARHTETGDIVAVKALAQNHNEDEHFRQRFESEIQALLKLDHPNIVRLLGFGEAEGAMYFAMELVEGQSLFSLQRSIKTFDWRDVLVICRDVASGLRHAHDRGIVHRDLKPGNLLKSAEGMIKITDFGIAKAYGVSHDTRDNVVGTIDYMSPEQALGRPVTHRSDLYSLGVVMFSLLSGQTPFASNSIEQSLRNLTKVAAPKIRSRVPTVPDALEEVIDELLEKKPENRTPTAYALLRKLDYVEQVLRDDSEAATSHGDGAGKSGNSLRAEATFRLGKPGAPSDNGPAPASKPSAVPVKSPTAPGKNTSRSSIQTQAGRETIVQTDLPEFHLESEDRPKADYFNTVTDDERRKVLKVDDDQMPHRGAGWFSILFCLIVVLAMTVYGIVQAVRVEPATVIYERIADNAHQPYRILEDINKFLTNYPDDERVGRVRELNDVALAIQKYNLLNLKAKKPGGNTLSVLEREFVSVVSEAEGDPGVGISKVEAFITVHDSGEDTPNEVQELVSAAKYYLKKIRNDNSFIITQERNAALAAMEQARENPAVAIDKYKSIIQLYGDKSWMKDFVEQAREELKKLEGNSNSDD